MGTGGRRKCEAARAPPGCQGRRVNEQRNERHTHRFVPPAHVTPNNAPDAQREQSFEGPTFAEGLVIVLDLYRDLIALAVWRRLGECFPKEAHELNSPAYW